MGKVGRPKRYKTQEAEKEALIRTQKQAERLDNLLKSKGISGRKLGDYLGVSDKSISKYRNGMVELPYEYAEKLCAAYGCVPEYWTGAVDVKTIEELEQLSENATDSGEAYRHDLQQKRADFFATCGFTYECSGMAQFDFLGVAPGTVTPAGNHRLTEKNGTFTADFTDEELEELERNLRDQIAFTCFKKSHS